VRLVSSASSRGSVEHGAGPGVTSALSATPARRWRHPAVVERLGDHTDDVPWLRQCHFCGNVQAMRVTLDAAGRLVVPKPLRHALGLKPGQVLEIRAGDGRLEIEIAPTPMRLRKRGKGLVAVPDAELPALTAEQVRDTLERVRR
jgi:AbrB family looped-hinge helix DNA binding protein